MNEATIRVQSCLHRANRAERRRKGLLLELLTRQEFLEAAWERVRGSEGAKTPGPDGQTVEDFDSRLGIELRRLQSELQRGTWKPGPTRLFKISKPGSNEATRAITLFCLRDRLVLTAMKQLLEPLLESRFHPDSFGFRPGRSVPAALQRSCDLLERTGAEHERFAHICALDVESCFPSIRHGRLQRLLKREARDVRFLRLLRRAIQPASKRMPWAGAGRVGLAQGSALSPLLCNLYLNEIDTALERGACKRGNRHRFLRYADNILLIAADERDLTGAHRLAQRTARRLGLRIRASSLESSCAKDGFDWLGVRIRPRTQAWASHCTYGYLVPDHKVDRILQRVSEMTAPPCSRIETEAFRMGAWIRSLNKELLSWHQAYVRADNAHEVFEAVDRHTRECVGQLLQQVTGTPAHRVPWRFGTRSARGFESLAAEGQRLVVLGSLPPRGRANLIRKPAWVRYPSSQSKQDPVQPNAAA